MKRNIISVIIGIIAAGTIFLIVENINLVLHPIPANLDFTDSVAVKMFYENQPLSFWLMVLAGWIIGSIVCGILIKWISKSSSKKLPIIAGGVLTLSAIANFFLLPHPSWFVIIGLLVFIPSAYFGHSIFKSKTV